MLVRSHLLRSDYLRIVKFNYVLGENDEGLDPYIYLFSLLKYQDFTEYVTEVINRYQNHLKDDSCDDEDDWIDEMVSMYGFEISSYSRDSHLSFAVLTKELIEFTFIIMDMLYDLNVDEVYNRPIDNIRIGEYGQATILFGEDIL